ncbi:hypothetical protein ACFDTO_19185 [Microbacteriaceae bacterium 4G12]
MNIDRLIETITKEVYRRLVEMEETAKQTAVIMSSEKQPLLEQKIKAKVNIAYYHHDICDADIVIIPDLSIPMLANLANGLSSVPEEHFVLSKLLEGKRVVIVRERMQHRMHKETAPPLLYKLYESYEQKLMDFGMEMVSFANLFQLADSECEKRGEPVAVPKDLPKEQLQAVTLDKKLITEADLQKLFLSKVQEIHILQNSIITPLANDYIRTHHLIVKRT